MNSERQILKRLLEGSIVDDEANEENLEESSFESNGSTYKCAFGKYYKDNEEISRDDYFTAKETEEGYGSNPVSSQLPDSVDNFLQDVAQMTGVISYNDIMDHEYTEEDINNLKSITQEALENAEDFDPEDYEDYLANEVGPKISSILKNSKSSESDPYEGEYIIGKEKVFISKDKESGKYYLHDGDNSTEEGFFSEDELKDFIKEMEPKKVVPSESSDTESSKEKSYEDYTAEDFDNAIKDIESTLEELKDEFKVTDYDDREDYSHLIDKLNDMYDYLPNSDYCDRVEDLKDELYKLDDIEYDEDSVWDPRKEPEWRHER